MAEFPFRVVTRRDLDAYVAQAAHVSKDLREAIVQITAEADIPDDDILWRFLWAIGELFTVAQQAHDKVIRAALSPKAQANALLQNTLLEATAAIQSAKQATVDALGRREGASAAELAGALKPELEAILNRVTALERGLADTHAALLSARGRKVPLWRRAVVAASKALLTGIGAGVTLALIRWLFGA
jgi:hypothetical protein